MLKKIYMILFVMVLLVSSFVSADLNSNLSHVYRFTETAGALIDSVGSIDSSSLTITDQNVGGKDGNAWKFVRNTDFVKFPAGTWPINNDNRCFSIWVNKTDNTGTQMLVVESESGGGFFRFYAPPTGSIIGVSYDNTHEQTGTLEIGIGKWSLVTVGYNNETNNITVWINGTKDRDIDTSGEAPLSTNSETMGIGNEVAEGGGLNGQLDEFNVWNRSCTQADVTELWNNGAGSFYPFTVLGAAATPIIVPPSPADNSHNNTNVTLNVTHSTTQNDVSYYLYFGDSTPLDEQDLYQNNVTRTGDEYRQFTTNVSDGTYYWKWRVQNTTDGTFSGNTTERTLIIDTVTPTITLQSSNFFASDNSTKINNYFANGTLNISFFDTFLSGGQTLINITNSTDESGFAIHNTSITITTVNISKILDISTWSLGNYTVSLSAADSHTLNAIEQYDVKQGFTYLEYTTTENIEIRITTLENLLGVRSISTEKLKDRYKFNFNFWNAKTDTTFRLTSNERLVYLKDSEYNGHFVSFSSTTIGGNWIDFNMLGLNKNNYEITKIDDYTYDITIKNINENEFEFNSIGGLNVIKEDYQFEITSIVNITAYDQILNKSLSFTSILNSITKHSGADNTTQYENVSVGTYTITLNSTGYDTLVTQLDITNSFHNFTLNMSLSNVIDDCTLYPKKVITFIGKDEETNEDVNMTLDITVFSALASNITLTTNLSFEFRNKFNYSFCTSANQSFLIDAIMQYGDGIVYTDRKYYLDNLTVTTTSPSEVFLYHLNNSKASEIVFTVFDTTTGDRISGATIKILRYYPGENVFRVVEIEKTDEIGETLGKMVLADVFYKFIIEKPPGIVKLDTDTLRILSLTRSFGISFVEDVLDTWDKIHGVSYSTTCTRSTKTCRVTWSDESNIVQSVTLEVWRVTGLVDTLLSSQTTVAAAGTISYTVVEDVATNTYEARAFARSTNPSDWSFGRARFFFSDNPFFTDETHRIASLFPLFLLVLVIIFALIDFGVIGIVIGSLLGMIVGSIIGILPIDPFYLISFILMAIILIYKLSK